MTSWGDGGIPQQEPKRTNVPKTAKAGLLETIREQFRSATQAVTRYKRSRYREREKMGGLFKRLALKIARRHSLPQMLDPLLPGWDPLAWLRLWEPGSSETHQPADVAPAEPVRIFNPVKAAYLRIL